MRGRAISTAYLRVLAALRALAAAVAAGYSRVVASAPLNASGDESRQDRAHLIVLDSLDGVPVVNDRRQRSGT